MSTGPRRWSTARRDHRISTRLALATASVTLFVVPAGVANASYAADDKTSSHRASATMWVERPPLTHARQGLDVATANGRILAIGGFAGDFVFDFVEARRVRGDGRWRTLAPLPTPRANLATAELGGAVYAVGGIGNNDVRLDVVEKFDLRAGSWSPSRRLPQPRFGAGAASLGGLLYVAGGATVADGTEQVTASMIAYNPRTRTWRTTAPMPTARVFLRLVTAGRHLYAIGGESIDGEILTTVERYEPRSNTWRPVASMNDSRRLPGVVTLRCGSGQFIAAVGGGSGPQDRIVLRRTTEIYNLNTGRWRVIPARLPHGRGSLVAATEADGTLLAIGGATDRGITGGPRIPTGEVLALRLTSRNLCGH
jgi:N-acetylneuraminic acid mutarotase